MNLLIWLATGVFIGWIASKVIGKERKLFGYLWVGILGSMFGGFIFDLLNIELAGYLGSVITSIIGAILLIFIVQKIKKK